MPLPTAKTPEVLEALLRQEGYDIVVHVVDGGVVIIPANRWVAGKRDEILDRATMLSRFPGEIKLGDPVRRGMRQ